MQTHPLPQLITSLILLVLHQAAFGQSSPPPGEAQREVAAQTGTPQLRAATGSVRLRSQTTKERDGSSAADSEFGEQRIVQRRAQVEPWSTVADAQLFTTDNVALTPTGEQRDWYLRYGLAVSYTNRIKGPLFIDLSLQQYLFRYSKFDALDFDLTRFDGGLLVQAPWLSNAFFFARYTLQRITEPGLGTAFFTNHAADLGVQKVWKISRGQQVFAGVAANLALDTSPGSGARNEYSATLGYSARLTERVTASASYRGSWNDYAEGPRTDWNHIVAAGVTYDATDWLRLGVNASFSHNDSNTSFADYDNFVAGCSIALRLAF